MNKHYFAVIFCTLAMSLALSAACSSKTGTSPTQVPLSPLGLEIKQILMDYCNAFNNFDEQGCLSYVAPDYIDVYKPALESTMKSFEAGRALKVKLVPTLFSEPVTMSDGRLDVRVMVSIVPAGLSKDQYLMLYMENVNGVWMVDYQGNDPDKTPPDSPTNLVCKIISVHRVDLTWDDNSSFETGFRVERSTDPQFRKDKRIFSLPANTVAYSDTTTKPGALYYYRVFAFDSAGDSNSSSVVTLQIPTSLSRTG
jgi:hypothetical protein